MVLTSLTAREAEVVGVGSEEKLYHLNGKEALSYAQIRKLDSDFGRTQRQRNVMEALYKKFQYADTDTLMKLFQRTDHATGSEMHPCLWLN